MLCFLETESSQTIRVHDLVWTRADDGWDLHKSSYPKLRLAPPWVEEQLIATGFSIRRHELYRGGLWATVAAR